MDILKNMCRLIELVALGYEDAGIEDYSLPQLCVDKAWSRWYTCLELQNL